MALPSPKKHTALKIIYECSACERGAEDTEENLPYAVHQCYTEKLLTAAAWSATVNPFSKQHGAPSDTERHVGDLGNFKTDEQGNAKGSIKDEHIKLYGKESVVGVSLTPLCSDMNGREADPSSFNSAPLLSIPVLMTLVRAVTSRAKLQEMQAHDLLAASLASLSRYQRGR